MLVKFYRCGNMLNIDYFTQALIIHGKSTVKIFFALKSSRYTYSRPSQYQHMRTVVSQRSEQGIFTRENFWKRAIGFRSNITCFELALSDVELNWRKIYVSVQAKLFILSLLTEPKSKDNNRLAS